MICGLVCFVIFLHYLLIQIVIVNAIAKAELRSYTQIQKGMNPEQVVGIMGRHYVKSFDNAGETFVWSLRRAGTASTYMSGPVATTYYDSPRTSYVAVRFEDGAVVSVKATNI